jgi:hypothetical protein
LVVTIPVARLLHAAMPFELPLPVGAIFGARVVSRDGDRGTLRFAGALLAARLPDGVQAGDNLRLRVEEMSPDKLVLKVVEPPQTQGAAQAQLQALPVLALPGGATARIFVEPDEEGRGAASGDGRPHTVFVHYDSPVLGNIDIALTLTGDAIGAAVQLIAGEPARAARAGAGALQGALAGAASRPALVQILARDETVDLRA